MLIATDLTKRFGDRTAVDRVGLRLRSGAITGLLGPNGAGKTTTIKMLVGALAPDRGAVAWADGRSLARSAIGIAPQSLAIYEELTAEENIRFFAKLYRLTGSALAQRLDWSLEFVGLASRRKDRVATFSGGMKRRLNLACAIVHDPDFILLDEPTVGVDPQSRNHIFDSVEGLRDHGKTILYTTHYMEEAERLCDEVAVIDQGRLLAEGSVANLIQAYGGPSQVTMSVDGADLPRGFPGTIDNDRLSIETQDIAATLQMLIAAGLRLDQLTIDRPDLESVFLNLTGRKLRDL